MLKVNHLVGFGSGHAPQSLAAVVAEAASALDVLDANTYSNMQEAASAADAPTALAVLAPSATETGSAADALNTATDYATSATETASAADDPSATTPDPHFASTVLLMGFEGANNSTGAPGMTDESFAARGNASVNTNAKISTAVFKFGVSSLALDGTSNTCITFPDSADWDWGTGEYAVELDCYFTSAPTNALLVAQWPSGWAFFTTGGSLIMRTSAGGDTTGYTFSPTLNQHYHIAFARDASNVARVFVDGAMVSKTTSFSANVTGSTGSLMIGSLNPGGFGGFNVAGYIDEVRITKGSGRGWGDGGFTAPTSAYPRS